MTRSQRFRRVLETLQIRAEDQRVVPLRFSASQELFWAHVAPKLDRHEPLWFIVLKGRQVYSTTFWAALSFVRTIERPGAQTLIVAHVRETAADIFAAARRFYETLPLPPLSRPRRGCLDIPFPDAPSQIRFTSAKYLGTGRGMNLTCVLGSEVAYWPNPEILVGLRQTVPSHGLDTVWVLESTANGLVGVGQPFYEEWKAAVDGRSDLSPIFIPWYIMPKYRREPPIPEDDLDDEERLLLAEFGAFGVDRSALAWRRFAIRTLCHGSVELFRQEYPTTPEEAFISSGSPAFDPAALMKQQKNLAQPTQVGWMVKGELQPAARGPVRVWRPPEMGHLYVIGVDTSEGVRGGDYSCAQVLDMGTLEQVAVMHGLLSPWDTAEQVAQLGRWYNTALVAVEVQGAGTAVQDYLIRVFSYPNLHLWRGRQDAIRSGQPRLYGWVTNVHTRPLLLETGRRLINDGLLTIHDRSTLDELTRFSRVDLGRYEAIGGHDDRVLALLIAARSREENYTGGGATVSPPLPLELDRTMIPRRVVESWTGDRRRAEVNAMKARLEAAQRSWMRL